jgi:uncharacterized membrane protein YeiH
VDLPFIDVLELAGTMAFAISGIRMASGSDLDWFGAYVIGLVTAIGGGTLRDLLLGLQPFWMTDASFFLTTAAALLASLLFKERIFRWGRTWFLFDSIGLGLFTVVGLSKSLEAELPWWVCITMGVITGSVGGVLRDVLLNRVPLLFQKDIYALTCVAGGLVFFAGRTLDLPAGTTETLASLTVILLRFAAVRYRIHLPKQR